MRFLKKNALLVAWIFSMLGILGSLYTSEILKMDPCVLCWYQRILIFPLGILLIIAHFRKDYGIYIYAAPLAWACFFLSSYQIFQFYKNPLACTACLRNKGFLFGGAFLISLAILIFLDFAKKQLLCNRLSKKI